MSDSKTRPKALSVDRAKELTTEFYEKAVKATKEINDCVTKEKSLERLDPKDPNVHFPLKDLKKKPKTMRRWRGLGRKVAKMQPYQIKDEYGQVVEQGIWIELSKNVKPGKDKFIA